MVNIQNRGLNSFYTSIKYMVLIRMPSVGKLIFLFQGAFSQVGNLGPIQILRFKVRSVCYLNVCKNFYKYVAMVCPGYWIGPKPSQESPLLKRERDAFSIIPAVREGSALLPSAQCWIHVPSAAQLISSQCMRYSSPPLNESISKNNKCIPLFVDFLLPGSVWLIYKLQVGVQNRSRFTGSEPTHYPSP